jgi:hypothetical protein
MEEALGAAQSQIVSGEIVVADYTKENACAY